MVGKGATVRPANTSRMLSGAEGFEVGVDVSGMSAFSDFTVSMCSEMSSKSKGDCCATAGLVVGGIELVGGFLSAVPL